MWRRTAEDRGAVSRPTGDGSRQSALCLFPMQVASGSLCPSRCENHFWCFIGDLKTRTQNIHPVGFIQYQVGSAVELAVKCG